MRLTKYFQFQALVTAIDLLFSSKHPKDMKKPLKSLFHMWSYKSGWLVVVIIIHYHQQILPRSWYLIVPIVPNVNHQFCHLIWNFGWFLPTFKLCLFICSVINSCRMWRCLHSSKKYNKAKSCMGMMVWRLCMHNFPLSWYRSSKVEMIFDKHYQLIETMWRSVFFLMPE